MSMNDVGTTFPSVEPQIAPELKNYLNKVWELRDEPNPDLYKVYVGGRSHKMEDDWEGWAQGQADWREGPGRCGCRGALLQGLRVPLVAGKRGLEAELRRLLGGDAHAD